MVKLINRNGSIMYVHESRVEEYTAAGYTVAKTSKTEVKEPVSVVEEPKIKPEEKPMRGLVEEPKAVEDKIPSFKKSSDKKRG